MSNDKDENKEPIYTPLTFTRHTYSKKNADKYKPFIDKCILKKTDEFISAESQGLQVNTLRQHINEALLWLCNNEDKEDHYKRIRPFLKVTPVKLGDKPGILLSWKVVKFTNTYKKKDDKIKAKDLSREITSSSIVNEVSKLSLNRNETSSNLHWKERVIKFITDDDAAILDISKPEDFRNIPLNEIDVEWLKLTFDKAGIEHEIDVFCIRAVKG